MTNTKNLCLSAINEYLAKPPIIEFKSISKEDRNIWIQNVIFDHKYSKCSRKDKGVLKSYMMRMTGISRAQLTRLIAECKKRGTLKPKDYTRHSFEKKYTKEDVETLADLDNAHECLAGPATIRILKQDYVNFAEIIIDKRGKEKKIYPKDNYMTPYEKFKSLENAEQYLKSGISFKELDKIPFEMSSTDYAKKMQKEKQLLFKNILR